MYRCFLWNKQITIISSWAGTNTGKIIDAAVDTQASTLEDKTRYFSIYDFYESN
jgi:hypothetical protein